MTNNNFGWRDLRAGMKIILRNGMLHRRVLFTAMGFTILYAILDPIDSYLIGRFIDAVTGNSTLAIPLIDQPIPLYLAILSALFVILVIENLVSRSRSLASLKLKELSRTTYISNTAEHMFRLPISFHKSVKMGEVQERLQTAANAVGDILGEDIITVVPQLISTIIFLTILFVLNHFVFAIVAIAIVIYVCTMIFMVRPTVTLQRQSQAAYAKVRGVIMDSILNIKIIKDFVAEKGQSEIIRSGYQQNAMPIWYKLMNYRRSQLMTQNLIVVMVRTCVFGISINLVRNGLWTIGDLVIANSYIGQIFTPLAALSNNWRNIQNGVIALEDTQKILDMPQEIYSPTASGGTEKRQIDGNIEFKNVSFGYTADRTILEDISFTVKAGQIIALVGESGVGKSTLIELISGYHFPVKGDITIDSTPIREVSLERLRSSIGVVTQELTLFNDTIRNNIRFGNLAATDEEVSVAAKKAHCDFIEKFPEKWDQVVGERGLKLSVGQKQRVAIARAILKNPRILILDEPTSALDAGSEKIISESLDNLMAGKTTFVVAHRLSTVRRADKILVFKEGRIVESGTHDELIALPGGEYRRLYELQIGLHD